MTALPNRHLTGLIARRSSTATAICTTRRHTPASSGSMPTRHANGREVSAMPAHRFPTKPAITAKTLCAEPMRLTQAARPMNMMEMVKLTWIFTPLKAQTLAIRRHVRRVGSVMSGTIPPAILCTTANACTAMPNPYGHIIVN